MSGERTVTPYLRLTKRMQEQIRAADPTFNLAVLPVLRPSPKGTTIDNGKPGTWIGVRLTEYFRTSGATFVGERAYVRAEMLSAEMLVHVACVGARPVLAIKRGPGGITTKVCNKWKHGELCLAVAAAHEAQQQQQQQQQETTTHEQQQGTQQGQQQHPGAPTTTHEQQPQGPTTEGTPQGQQQHPQQREQATTTTTTTATKKMQITTCPTIRVQLPAPTQAEASQYHAATKNMILRQNFGFVSAELSQKEMAEQLAGLKFLAVPLDFIESDVARELCVTLKIVYNTSFESSFALALEVGTKIGVEAVWFSNGTIRMAFTRQPTAEMINSIKGASDLITQIIPDVFPANPQAPSDTSSRSSNRSSNRSDSGTKKLGPIGVLQSVNRALTGSTVIEIMAMLNATLVPSKTTTSTSVLIRLPAAWLGPDTVEFEGGVTGGGTACTLSVLRPGSRSEPEGQIDV